MTRHHSRRLAGGLLLAALASAGVAETRIVAADAPIVSAALVYWDQERGFETIVENADVITHVSPFWYSLDDDGRARPYTTQRGLTHEDPSIVAYLRGRGIAVIPTIANVADGVWNGEIVRRIISDPEWAGVHVDELVRLVVAGGYDGLDLDYEALAASDRDAFSRFVRRLADALHAEGKLLAVDVYGKTAEPGTWDGPAAQDWAALGAAADQVRIMAYNYHWSTSAPGPVAPAHWIAEVLAFARSVIPAEKIVLGVPFYGYGWPDATAGTALVWEHAEALRARHDAPLRWDAPSASPWFEFTADGSRHTVWFENAASLDAKLGRAATAGIGGVFLWRLGGEDPGVWTALRTRARARYLDASCRATWSRSSIVCATSSSAAM